MKIRISGLASFTSNLENKVECIASKQTLLGPVSGSDVTQCTAKLLKRWDPYYIRSLERFSSAGIIPPLSPAQLEAADVLEATCNSLALHMILEVGDIQFLSNAHVLHARTAYKDHAPPAPRRHLMRLWLATPEGEGGWKLPFCDSGERKRGGIQVDDVGPVAHLDAD